MLINEIQQAKSKIINLANENLQQELLVAELDPRISRSADQYEIRGQLSTDLKKKKKKIVVFVILLGDVCGNMFSV